MSRGVEIFLQGKKHLTVFILMSCFIGFVLQVFAVLYTTTDLCDNLQDVSSYCNTNDDSFSNNTIHEADEIRRYNGFRAFAVITLFVELLAFIKAYFKVCCYDEQIRKRCCTLWESYDYCWDGWHIMAGIATMINLISIIYVCSAIPFVDLIRHVRAFQLIFANMCFGATKLTVWCVHLKHRPCFRPDSIINMATTEGYYKAREEQQPLPSDRRINASGTTGINEQEIDKKRIGTSKLHLPASVHL